MQEFTISQLSDVALTLKSGKALIAPTDTVWGIIADNEDIIYDVKQRPSNKKIVSFVNNITTLGLPSAWVDTLSTYLPGALTFIYRQKSYRVPDSSFILQLIDMVGPLYCSSANISGQQPIASVQEAKIVFGSKDSKLAILRPPKDWKLSSIPSTIIDLDNMKVIRQGSIDGNEIINKLQKGSK